MRGAAGDANLANVEVDERQLATVLLLFRVILFYRVKGHGYSRLDREFE